MHVALLCCRPVLCNSGLSYPSPFWWQRWLWVAGQAQGPAAIPAVLLLVAHSPGTVLRAVSVCGSCPGAGLRGTGGSGRLALIRKPCGCQQRCPWEPGAAGERCHPFLTAAWPWQHRKTSLHPLKRARIQHQNPQ